MRRYAISAVLLLAGLLAVPPAVAVSGLESDARKNPASKLHRNPFEKPALVRRQSVTTANVPQAPPPWTPELRATLVSGGDLSLANVDGEMVKKGEEYQGYTLVEVREREAVFERGGKRWVLSLD